MFLARLNIKNICLCLLPLIVVSCQSGCSIARTKSEVAGNLAEFWRWEAGRARIAEAKKAHEKKEKALAKAQEEPQGTIEEVVKTDYTITLEKGMEIESIGLDFGELRALEKQQAQMEEAYKKELDAYHKLQVLEKIQKMEQARTGGGKNCGCAKPEQESALGPPPKKPAVGLDNLPVVIHARYKMTPRQTSFARTNVERNFVPGQACQPCEQGAESCTDACTDNDQTTGTSSSANGIFQAPASEARNRQKTNRLNYLEKLNEPLYRPSSLERLEHSRSDLENPLVLN
ncbi:MAG: hypothetical protein HUJ26_05810 [Planctomycetaceae bacterium]|nr:hypothetical protein [Planctomycetaceae bacterium]